MRMKDKLRGLAERWSDRKYDSTDTSHGYSMGLRQARNELLAILDAEGDGGAVATVGQPPDREELVSASLAIGGWLAAALDDPAVCAEMKRDINRWFDAAMPSAQAHPARSGVVSDEDVNACVDVYEAAYNENDLDVREKMRDPDTECMRAALEHFAKGERHER